jgi:hypothetical protein
MKKELRLMLCFMAAALVFGFTDVASAITAPAAGSFAYDVYDIGINKILQGPIGFVGGVVAIVIGAIAAIRAQIMLAIPAILGGAVILKADAITTSLGITI